MVFVPTILTVTSVQSSSYKNIYRLVEEYKVANSYITVQDQTKNASYPLYTIYVPDVTRSARDFTSNGAKRTLTIQVDFDATESQGWKKASEMYEALDAGIDSENSNLHAARLKYMGSRIIDNSPLDINGQMIFGLSAEFEFEVLL